MGMENTRTIILRHAKEIAISSGDVPSLNTLAESAGLSKGGLLHYFPSRQALLEAVVFEGISELDSALEEAVNHKKVLSTWLDLSLPEADDLTLYSAISSVFFASRSNITEIKATIAEAYLRWTKLLENELGTPEAANVAVLLGDGLFLSSLAQNVSKEKTRELKQLAERTIQAMASTQS